MSSLENLFNERNRRVVEASERSIRKMEEDLYKDIDNIKKAIGYDVKDEGKRLDEVAEEYIHKIMTDPRRTRHYNN